MIYDIWYDMISYDMIYDMIWYIYIHIEAPLGKLPIVGFIFGMIGKVCRVRYDMTAVAMGQESQKMDG